MPPEPMEPLQESSVSVDVQPRPRTDDDSPWCVLCGRAPMPVVAELPDGCCAHPGCADDPVFADLLPDHRIAWRHPNER